VAAGTSAVAALDSTPDSRLVWFPDEPAFTPLLAAPREVGLRGSIIGADRPDAGDFEGTNAEAEVSIGHRIPVVEVQSETATRPRVVIGFEVGVFSRFFLETSTKDLINTDFRVGAPVSLRFKEWEGRAELLHVSSHIGDDFLRRFPTPGGQVSRDGFEFLLARRFLHGARAYLGLDYNFHVNEGVERSAARGGIEWNPHSVSHRRRLAWPFAAADFQLASKANRLAGTGSAGVLFDVNGKEISLELRGHFGPSPMGQLRNTDENFIGIGLRVKPY